MQLGFFVGASFELFLTQKGAVEPQTGQNVRRLFFVLAKVLLQIQQDPDVLLSVAPATFCAMGQQTAHQFGVQRVLRLVGQQRAQQNGVGTARTVKQQILALAFSVACRELRFVGGLGGSVFYEATDLGEFRRAFGVLA